MCHTVGGLTMLSAGCETCENEEQHGENPARIRSLNSALITRMPDAIRKRCDVLAGQYTPQELTMHQCTTRCMSSRLRTCENGSSRTRSSCTRSLRKTRGCRSRSGRPDRYVARSARSRTTVKPPSHPSYVRCGSCCSPRDSTDTRPKGLQ